MWWLADTFGIWGGRGRAWGLGGESHDRSDCPAQTALRYRSAVGHRQQILDVALARGFCMVTERSAPLEISEKTTWDYCRDHRSK
jgi:hypothetical protein